jgi:hypothetical protein
MRVRVPWRLRVARHVTSEARCARDGIAVNYCSSVARGRASPTGGSHEQFQTALHLQQPPLDLHLFLNPATRISITIAITAGSSTGKDWVGCTPVVQAEEEVVDFGGLAQDSAMPWLSDGDKAETVGFGV